MKTIVYIDGFNFYNGRLAKTNYKWLDLCKFGSHICQLLGSAYPVEPEPLIRYYTSAIKRHFSIAPETAPQNQQTYLRALKHECGGNLRVYMGRFNHGKIFAYDASEDAPHVADQPEPKIRVWKLEEKRVDVALASDLIIDAISGSAGAQIVVSNDEDLEPAILAVARQKPRIPIGIVSPSKKTQEGRLTRPPNNKLVAATGRNDVLPYVNDSILDACMLPTPVRTPKNWTYCPIDWLPPAL